MGLLPIAGNDRHPVLTGPHVGLITTDERPAGSDGVADWNYIAVLDLLAGAQIGVLDTDSGQLHASLGSATSGPAVVQVTTSGGLYLRTFPDGRILLRRDCDPVRPPDTTAVGVVAARTVVAATRYGADVIEMYAAVHSIDMVRVTVAGAVEEIAFAADGTLLIVADTGFYAAGPHLLVNDSGQGR